MSKNSVPFVFNGNGDNRTITVILNGDSRSIRKNHPKYKDVVQALKDDNSAEEILEVLDGPVVEEEPVSYGNYSDLNLSENVCVKNNAVYCGDETVDSSLTEEVLQILGEGLPVAGMVKFIERLYDSAINPNGKRVSSRVRSELLEFIKRNGIVVDKEGFIIAYKAVLRNYWDKYTGRTFKNLPGTVVSMDYGKVNDNAAHGCGRGLHAGSLQYVGWYGGGDDRIVIVKIDPSDVVSVPSDSQCQKLRTCKYTVIGDYQGELQRSVYDTDNVDEMYDQDYDFDDDYDEGWDEFDDLDDDYDDDYYNYGGYSCDPPEQEADDMFDPGDISTSQTDVSGQDAGIYGVKPSGMKFYNRRGPDGKFSSN